MEKNTSPSIFDVHLFLESFIVPVLLSLRPQKGNEKMKKGSEMKEIQSALIVILKY